MTGSPAARFPLWDLPTRLCHWLIVACVPLAWLTAETGNYQAHEWLGYAVIVLVVGRILWGFVGSLHSRFTDFLVGPRSFLAYLRGEGYQSAGHNPLGGLSVLALLGLLLLQAVSGLFNSDDVLYSGPLYYAAESGFRDAMGTVHDVVFNVLLAMVLLHLMAITWHQRRGGEKLLQAMWRGHAPGREGREAPRPWWLALGIFGLVATVLWQIIERAPQPTPMW